MLPYATALADGFRTLWKDIPIKGGGPTVGEVVGPRWHRLRRYPSQRQRGPWPARPRTGLATT